MKCLDVDMNNLGQNFRSINIRNQVEFQSWPKISDDSKFDLYKNIHQNPYFFCEIVICHQTFHGHFSYLFG